MSVFDILNPIGDVATSVFDRVPWAKDAYDQGKTWVLGVAKSQPWLIDVITNSVGIPALLPIVGPAATALWAVPGLAKGEPFAQAYVQGFTQRLVQLAQYLAGQGASEALQKQATEAMASQVQEVSNDPAVQQAIASIATQQTNEAVKTALVQAHLTPEELAARFGVRPDAAAFAIDALLKRNVYDPNEFQVPDGTKAVVVPPGAGPLRSSASYLTDFQILSATTMALQQAQAAGIPGTDQKIQAATDRIRQVRELYELALSTENPPRDATFWATQLTQAKASGAPPATVANIQRNLDQAVARQNLSGKGLTFDVRNTPIGFGKPAAGTVLLDLAVVGAALYALFRFGRR